MSDNLLALITTAVDGELSAVDRLRFDHLLDSSAEARSIYDKLKADSDRLRNLPHAVPPRNLHQRVMAQIAAVTPIPVTPFSRPIIQSLPVDRTIVKSRKRSNRPHLLLSSEEANRDLIGSHRLQLPRACSSPSWEALSGSLMVAVVKRELLPTTQNVNLTHRRAEQGRASGPNGSLPITALALWPPHLMQSAGPIHEMILTTRNRP